MNAPTAFSAAALVRPEDFATASTSSALVILALLLVIYNQIAHYYIRKNTVCKGLFTEISHFSPYKIQQIRVFLPHRILQNSLPSLPGTPDTMQHIDIT
jgi:hypothetical protein